MLLVALTGRRARPLREIVLESGARALPAYRTRAGLMEAAAELALADDDGVARAVAVDAVHALAHVGVAGLAGLVIDAGLLGSAFVPAELARAVVAGVPPRDSRPPPAPALPAEPPGAATQASPPRVVVVDDDAMVLRALDRFLSSHGATVHTVSSALEAAAVVYLQQPTVVVLDVLMPGMDGERTWSLLRSASAKPPRVVFYSGIGPRELAAVAPGDPYVDRVSKDAGPEALLAAVERAHRLSVAG